MKEHQTSNIRIDGKQINESLRALGLPKDFDVVDWLMQIPAHKQRTMLISLLESAQFLTKYPNGFELEDIQNEYSKLSNCNNPMEISTVFALKEVVSQQKNESLSPIQIILQTLDIDLKSNFKK